MRINKFIAHATGMSRRAADQVIAGGRVTINGIKPSSGYDVLESDVVRLDNSPLLVQEYVSIVLNKPVGYVVSRDGQGAPTVYDLLPAELHHLKSVGRLDKNSSGLLILSNDGELANRLTHPRYNKKKIYTVTLNKPLTTLDGQHIEKGVKLEDGISRLLLDGKEITWTVVMSEGRNRQIRRTFEALGYNVRELHRTNFGEYELGELPVGEYIKLL